MASSSSPAKRERSSRATMVGCGTWEAPFEGGNDGATVPPHAVSENGPTPGSAPPVQMRPWAGVAVMTLLKQRLGGQPGPECEVEELLKAV